MEYGFQPNEQAYDQRHDPIALYQPKAHDLRGQIKRS